jgi:hypothetical protein
MAYQRKSGGGNKQLEFAVLAHWGWELKATHAYLNANKL